METDTGSLVWELDLAEMEIYASATIVDDKIFIPTNDGNLFCLVEKGQGKINTPPVLIDMDVEPESGYDGDSFTFSVRYIDTDNDPPVYVRLFLDGDMNEMQSVSDGLEIDHDQDYSNGEKYSLITELDEGKHRFHFETSDGESTYISDVDSITVKSPEDNPNNDNDPGTGNGSENNNPTPGFDFILISMAIIFCFILKKRELIA